MLQKDREAHSAKSKENDEDKEDKNDRDYLLRAFMHWLCISSYQFTSLSPLETMNFWKQELHVLFIFIYSGISSTEHIVQNLGACCISVE